MMKQKEISCVHFFITYYFIHSYPGIKALNFSRISSDNLACALFYLNDLDDKKLAAYYIRKDGTFTDYSILYSTSDVDEKEKISKYIFQRAIEGDIDAQNCCVSHGIINN